LCLALCSTLFAGELKPLHMAEQEPIEGQYIVVLRPNMTMDEVLLHVSNVPASLVIDVYDIITFKGYAARMSADAVQKLRASDDILYITQDAVVRSDACSTQSGAIWNLARISERDPELRGIFNYESRAGANVDAYILDTGIYVEHTDFEGRAFWGVNYVGDGRDTDCNGHGTHVAGTVAGRMYGVAKQANLVAVKVLGCGGSGSWAGVISGIEWSVSESRKSTNRAVANMSLGGGFNAAVNDAVTAAVRAGITYAIAAGNDNNNACNTSPASTPSAITVGATTTVPGPGDTQVDQRSSFSNYGTCVDIFAPGSLILSDWIGSPTATNTISGTSMAAPHVCGAAALFLAENPNAEPELVKQFLNGVSTKNKINLNCPATGVCRDSPNFMLYTPC